MPQNILFSKVYMHLKYPREKTKFALKLASVFHRAVLTNGHVPRVPGFFLNGVVPCTDHCANYIGTLSFPICVTDRKGKVMHGTEGELVMGKKKRGNREQCR